MKILLLILAFLYLGLRLKFYKNFNDLLLKSAKDIEYQGNNVSILMCMLKYDADLKYIKYLINKGEQVNAKDGNGKTVLMYAAQYCSNTEILKFILSFSVNTIAKDKSGKTALDYAHKNKKNSRVVKIMTKAVRKQDNKDNILFNFINRLKFNNKCNNKMPDYETDKKIQYENRQPTSLTIDNKKQKNVNFKTGKNEILTTFHSRSE